MPFIHPRYVSERLNVTGTPLALTVPSTLQLSNQERHGPTEKQNTIDALDRYPGQPAGRPPAGYEPDRGYSRPPERQQAAPSYVGADAPVVDGRNVDLGLVCFGDGSKAGLHLVGRAAGPTAAPAT